MSKGAVHSYESAFVHVFKACVCFACSRFIHTSNGI